MGFNIIIEYPFWFLLLCLLAGIAYSMLLYFRNRNEEFSRAVNVILALLRFITVSILTFLIFSPMLRSTVNTKEDPLIIIAHDNSASIIQTADSSYYKNEFPGEMDRLRSALSEDYQVISYLFGEDLRNIENSYSGDINYSDKQTDYSYVFEELENRHINRNVGAIILATDGIYNRGINPLYLPGMQRYPIYPIALGDTGYRQDIIISKVNYNRIAYLGNEFPVEIVIKAHQLKGKRSKLEVVKDEETIFSKYIDFTSNYFVQAVMAFPVAEETGLQRYRIEMQPLQQEHVTGNNISDIYIEILDSRKKILILYEAPHPDVSAIKQAIESNYHYEVTIAKADNFFEPLAAYNLVVLHQVPSVNQTSSGIAGELQKSDVPRLYIIGTNSSLESFNQLENSLQITSLTKSHIEAIPVVNSNFVLFELSDKTRKTISSFPPLTSPFGQYQKSVGSSVMLYQKIGNLTTDYPLVLFSNNIEYKSACITGEGLWKWRIMDYKVNDSHESFNEIINKTVQYLSLKETKQFFRIDAPGRINENEQVEFDAEVYNKSYELINEPEVELEIIDQDSNIYKYTFGRRDESYYLNAGNFRPGSYSYKGRVEVGSDVYFESGQYTVEPLSAEFVNIVADHNLLFNLAANSGGQVVFPDEISSIPDKIETRSDIRTVVYQERKYERLNNIVWIMVGLFILLAAEWFVRKYKGSY